MTKIMKRLLVIVSVILLAGMTGCQKEEIDLVQNEKNFENDKQFAKNYDGLRTMKNINMRLVDSPAIDMDLTTVIFDDEPIEENLKSANIVPTNYFQRIDVLSGPNSFLQIFCRNKNKVDGRSGMHVMNQFLIELPDFITDEDITEIKYARKNAEDGEPYTIRDDDDDWKVINEKIKDEVRLGKYTVNNVLKIEQGLQNDDWLIVKIRLNKSVNYTLSDAPYYIKIASEWYLYKTVGFWE